MNGSGFCRRGHFADATKAFHCSNISCRVRVTDMSRHERAKPVSGSFQNSLNSVPTLPTAGF